MYGALSPGVMQRSADILLQRPYQHRVLSLGPSHADEVVQLELEGGRRVAHSGTLRYSIKERKGFCAAPEVACVALD